MDEHIRSEHVTVSDGDIPVFVSEYADRAAAPGIVVVPSIYGPGSDLLEQMAGLADIASTAVLDPFWREGGGAVDYTDRDGAIGRLGNFDIERCRHDVEAVARWMAERSNGFVVGVGICFGGPYVLIGAAQGWLGAAVTWHGSRLDQTLGGLGEFDAPLRLHFGGADPVTPPDVIETVRHHFAEHGDCEIFVHDGANHGFSFRGPAWDPVAADACVETLRALLTGR